MNRSPKKEIRREATPENSPGECRDSERPDLAAFAAAHELGFTRADQARELIAGLLHGIQEARDGAGGCRP